MHKSQLFSLEREIIAVENAINILLGQTYAPVTRGLLNDQQQFPLDIPRGFPLNYWSEDLIFVPRNNS